MDKAYNISWVIIQLLNFLIPIVLVVLLFVALILFIRKETRKHDKGKQNGVEQASSMDNQYAKSPAEQVRELKGLLDDGIITEEEFNAKKKELLGL